MGRALWLPQAISNFGVPVKLVSGWESRGSSAFNPQGVVCHHTASSAGSDHPALGICTYGRSDLPGPLCNVLLARNGDAYIVASGRANHAGSGGYRGLYGNSSVLGIEAENNGVGEPWSQNQLRSYHRICAAMCSEINRDASWVCGHKEWTSRKIDPAGINMNDFRVFVQQVLITGGDDVMTDAQMKELGKWMQEQRVQLYEDLTSKNSPIMKAIFGNRKLEEKRLQAIVDEAGLDVDVSSIQK